MNSIDLYTILPEPVDVEESLRSLRPNSHLILAAGIEDRTVGFLGRVTAGSSRRPFRQVSLLNYLPYDSASRQNKRRILNCLKRLGSKPMEYDFDSASPADFPEIADEIVEAVDRSAHVYIDISSMSKLLILYLLNALWKRNRGFSVIYGEAKKYRPSQSEYKQSLRQGHFGQNISMEFLFSGVFEPIIPQPFVGRAPLGRTRALVMFLGFNKRQSIGAAAIVPYQCLIPIVGVPPNPKWRWREDALIQINNYGLLASGQRISDVPRLEILGNKDSAPTGEYRLHLSTFDYAETLRGLLWISDTHRYTHFLTIAPFGSKLQALGAFLFSRVHPETQMVYALPREFHPRYSQGVNAIYEIDFSNPRELESQLISRVKPNLLYLEQLAQWGRETEA